jgi:hypothetical protein
MGFAPAVPTATAMYWIEGDIGQPAFKVSGKALRIRRTLLSGLLLALGFPSDASK